MYVKVCVFIYVSLYVCICIYVSIYVCTVCSRNRMSPKCLSTIKFPVQKWNVSFSNVKNGISKRRLASFDFELRNKIWKMSLEVE